MSFDDREKAYEEKFARDKEAEFKVTARRDKLLGLWAAEKLGLSGAQAEQYAKEVVMADIAQPGDEDVEQKLLQDFAAAGVEISLKEIRQAMHRFHAQARAQLLVQ